MKNQKIHSGYIGKSNQYNTDQSGRLVIQPIMCKTSKTNFFRIELNPKLGLYKYFHIKIVTIEGTSIGITNAVFIRFESFLCLIL